MLVCLGVGISGHDFSRMDMQISKQTCYFL